MSTGPLDQASAGRRSRAAFTIVQNEPLFLPLWLDYYGRHFGPDDLYVLDHDSTDGSTCGLEGRCHVVPVHRSASFDHHWMKETVEQFQRFLFRSYATVLYSDCDEFVIADPAKYRGLADYIDKMPVPVARCSGFNVVHLAGEPPLDAARPVLAQRGTWYPSRLFSKTLLSRVPLQWVTGFHEVPELAELKPDPDLALAHLHRVDYGLCHDRHRAKAAVSWNALDLQLGYGTHNRIVEEAEFREWFYHGPQLVASQPEAIPERLRAVL
ncbi:MAG TPA: glycosyltransferase family 2 protein [Kiritimatiellia bacterium]|jgi:hypothetical protein